jgi:hypothetical protein
MNGSHSKSRVSERLLVMLRSKHDDMRFVTSISRRFILQGICNIIMKDEFYQFGCVAAASLLLCRANSSARCRREHAGRRFYCTHSLSVS